MSTWWVAAQDRATGVVYVTVESGNDQFPSGDLPSISEAAGPFSTKAAADTVTASLNAAPGGGLGVKAPGGFQAWFYNSATGQVILDTNAITAQGDKLRVAIDPAQWHEYATNADMLAAIAAHHWPPPQYQNSVAQNVANAPGQAAQLLTGLPAIGDFFQRLTQGSTWIRVGEFLLGALLLISGALHLSGRSADLKDIAKLTPVGKLL